MAAAGTANTVSRNMAFTLFKNVVDYADKYRGMQSVTVNEYEAYADISLDPDRHGTWREICYERGEMASIVVGFMAVVVGVGVWLGVASEEDIRI